jgi:hypothetical protein
VDSIFGLRERRTLVTACRLCALGLLAWGNGARAGAIALGELERRSLD